MPVKMQPTSVIKTSLGIDPNGRVQRFFTNTCKKHMEKYVPVASGKLREVVLEEPTKITYEQPYAHYQYEGILYVDPETGSSWARKDTKKVATAKELVYHRGGGSHWDKRMVSAEMQDIVKEVQDFIRR